MLSVAVNETETGAVKVAAHDAPLHAIVVAGGVVSGGGVVPTVTTWVLTVSALLALSHDANLTVVVAETVNGAV